MAFQTPMTIKNAITCISKNEYVLPAIQREFVWNTDQITRLFDSLMRGYPIGSFLFWDVKKENCQDYKFYGFLADYHERDNRHNPHLDLTGENSITAILDGQQRLTALNIGLRGSYTERTKYKRPTTADAYPKKRLYLNLLEPIEGEDVELMYNLQFLTEEEAQNVIGKHWFLVSQIQKFEDLKEIFNYLRNNNIFESEFPQECLCKLYEVICKERLVNCFLEEDQELDKVLNIFIRVNSGGTVLNHSDLLLSIATAQWRNEDAREVVHDLVDDLNRTGQGFDFTKDFILKSCLVLADIPDIGFKVRNFTRKNMEKIETSWTEISDALRLSVNLASQFGYNWKTLTANNALIPIAYYLLKRELSVRFLDRAEFSEDRQKMHQWITRAILKTGTFGSSTDTTLRSIRETIESNHDSFPIDAIENSLKKFGKVLSFETEEIEDLLDQTHGKRLTFSVLSLLYPHVDFRNHFHEDHIFPKSQFTKTKLQKAGVPEEQIDEFISCRDKVANLQLLEGMQNQQKSSKMPNEWLNESNSINNDVWKERNFITGDIPTDIRDFMNFYNQRREKMKFELTKILDPYDF